MPQSRTEELSTAAGKTLDVIIDGDSQVEVTGTFGSVALTGETGLVIERTITANEAFASSMTNMKFVLTGTGPIQVTVSPTRIANISKYTVTA